MCPQCKRPNEGNKLGRLGGRIHYRCRDCGWTYSREAPSPCWLGVKGRKK